MTGSSDYLNSPDELLQAYTAMFLFLGGSVSMNPDKAALPHLCDSGLLRNLPVTSNNENFKQASRLLKSPCPLKQQCHHAVNNNFETLLHGHNTGEAYPAASLWISSEMPLEERHRQLNGFYSRYGYSKANECGLEPDHLGIELLFTNLLIEKYLTEDDYSIRALVRDDLLDFINNEMLSWLPRWAARVSNKSVTKCYTGISGLIIGGLEDVRDILNSQKLGL